ncbi:hypothetical protein [Microbacterium indicum]|uniref:hypothetical protein n=1 Tax=Microbacterium indicum TaxID=358100 RepID=UPI00041A2581|nr:hypothetical protein [Microbacterium indicum]
MGLFGRKKTDEERLESAMSTAEKIGSGKGLVGGLTKMTMGSRFTDQVGDAMASMRSAQAGMAAAQNGVTEPATVTGLTDTGQTINDNPVLVLRLDRAGEPIELRTMVARIQIPRVGDTVLLAVNPADGQLVYAGLAV